jgi:hypothetical protein
VPALTETQQAHQARCQPSNLRCLQLPGMLINRDNCHDAWEGRRPALVLEQPCGGEQEPLARMHEDLRRVRDDLTGLQARSGLK